MAGIAELGRAPRRPNLGLAVTGSFAVYFVPVFLGVHAIIPWGMAIDFVLSAGTGAVHTLSTLLVAAAAQFSAGLAVYLFLRWPSRLRGMLLFLAIPVATVVLSEAMPRLDALDSSRYPGKFVAPAAR